MLSNIYIENVAVIEKASIDFDNLFNVLTGETGAGKSIIIDSINAIMGQRISKDLIRSGAQSSFISATFTEVSDGAKAAFEECGYSPEDDMFILQRQISLSGKNTCKINGRPAPLSVFKKVSGSLVNIYGQNEGYDFMTADSHIHYIDAVGDYSDLLQEYKTKFLTYTQIRRKIIALNDNIQDRARKIDLLKYQIREIEQADLHDGEIEEIEEQRALLINSEKIRNGLLLAHSLLAGEEEEGAVSILDTVNDTLRDISEMYSPLADTANRIQSAYEEIKDCQYEISSFLDETDMDPDALAEVEERYELIKSLRRKYGDTIKEILDYCENAKREFNTLQEFDSNKEKLMEQFHSAKTELVAAAQKLTEKRTATANEFSRSVMEEMRYLDMPNVVMVPQVTKCEYSENGCDRVELLISANPGEEPKPLTKIASGGELSRIMLAVKTIIAEKDEIATLIFDEIDTGISGSAASKVGRKLQQLSKTHQVLCITHQAQIASLADTHMFISKSVTDGRTYTKIRRLDFEERKHELSRIIDGDSPSELSLKHAEEMLNSK